MELKLIKSNKLNLPPSGDWTWDPRSLASIVLHSHAFLTELTYNNNNKYICGGE